MIRPASVAFATVILSLSFAGTAWPQDTVLFETFANNAAGWSLDPEWAIGPATPSSGENQGNPDPDSDADGVFGGGVAGVVIGGNAATTTHDYYYLTSPSVNTLGLDSVELSFQRHLNSDYLPYMANAVEVFDGTQWNTVWETGGPPGNYDSEWTPQKFDISPFSNAGLQVRFGFRIGSSGVYTVSSWNLDNIRIGERLSTLFESFDDNSNGWTLDTEWEIGPATESTGNNQGNPDPDSDGNGVFAGGVAGVVIGGNAQTAIHDYYYLTSPVLDTTPLAAVELSFDRFLNSDYLPYMQNAVEVFDGSEWVTVWETGGPPGNYDSEWTPQKFDITPFSNTDLQVRFGFRVGSSGAYTVSSWNLDNVRIDKPRTALFEKFDDNSQGWTLDTEWEIGPATESAGHNQGNPDPGSDGDGVFAGGVAGVVIGGNAQTAIHDYYYLTSPPLDTTGHAGVELSFDRHLNSDYLPYMQNSVEVFDGTEWIAVWETGGPPGTYDAEWTRQSYDISAYSNADLQVRFGFRVGSSGVYTVSSWNLDNVSIGPKFIGEFEDNFDDDSKGWILGPEWEIGSATESSGHNQGFPDPDSDADGVFAGGVAGVVIGGNAETVVHDFYYLTSPIVDTTSLTTVELTYQRHLNSDYLPYMQNSVEVFDGTDWFTLWETGGPPGTYEDTWSDHSYDLTPYSNAGLQVRFGFRIGSGGVYTVSSWNLDNVRIGEAMSGQTFIRGDMNGDGAFNALVDGLYMLAFGFLGGPPPPCLEATDANGDGVSNALVDTLHVLTHGFLGGPPPVAPFPTCGSDPDPASSLGCDSNACP